MGIHLPEDYPSASAPVLEIHGAGMSAEVQAEAIRHLHELFQPGEVSLGCLSSAILGESCLLP